MCAKVVARHAWHHLFSEQIKLQRVEMPLVWWAPFMRLVLGLKTGKDRSIFFSVRLLRKICLLVRAPKVLSDEMMGAPVCLIHYLWDQLYLVTSLFLTFPLAEICMIWPSNIKTEYMKVESMTLSSSDSSSGSGQDISLSRRIYDAVVLWFV